MSQVGELGSGANKGGGGGGAIREGGGSFGKKEAVHEEEYFRKQQRKQLEEIKAVAQTKPKACGNDTNKQRLLFVINL